MSALSVPHRLLAALLAVALLVAGFLVASASPSGAAVEGGCTGSAVINGVTYTPANDTRANPVVVPPGPLQVEYEGSTNFDNQGHAGSVAVTLGPVDITVGEWQDDNGDEPNGGSDAGEIQLDDLRDEVPFDLRGLYLATGEHTADGGSCSGFVLVKFDGPVFDSPLALAAAGTSALALILLLLAGLVPVSHAAAGAARGRPVLGVLSGLLLGLAGAVLVQQFGIAPPTTALLLGALVLGLLAGIAMAFGAPFGRGRVGTAAAGTGGTDA